MSELRGSVVDVVRTLREENDWDAVLEIVSKLVAENADMSRRLAQVKRSFKTSEKIGRAQLVLFVDALARGEGDPESNEADADGSTNSTKQTRNFVRPPASTRTRTTRSRRAGRDRLVSPRTEFRSPSTHDASTTHCSYPWASGRVLAAGPSARALATTSPRWSS